MPSHQSRPHPIDPSVLEPKPAETAAIADIEDTLDRVQATLAADLAELHREAVTGSDRIAAWDTISDDGTVAYLFLGHFEEYWAAVFEALDVDDPSTQRAVRLLHARQAERTTRVDGHEALVIRAPHDWASGSAAARHELASLLEAGLSGAEAIDVWFLAFGPEAETQTEQGHRRGVSPQAVHNNVQQGVAKLDDRAAPHLSVNRLRE